MVVSMRISPSIVIMQISNNASPANSVSANTRHGDPVSHKDLNHSAWLLSIILLLSKNFCSMFVTLSKSVMFLSV